MAAVRSDSVSCERVAGSDEPVLRPTEPFSDHCFDFTANSPAGELSLWTSILKLQVWDYIIGFLGPELTIFGQVGETVEVILIECD